MIKMERSTLQPKTTTRKHTPRFATSSPKLACILCSIILLLLSPVGTQKYIVVVSGTYICDNVLGDCHVTCERHCDRPDEKNVDSNGDGLAGMYSEFKIRLNGVDQIVETVVLTYSQ
jgi:hypothetical protein